MTHSVGVLRMTYADENGCRTDELADPGNHDWIYQSNPATKKQPGAPGCFLFD